MKSFSKLPILAFCLVSLLSFSCKDDTRSEEKEETTQTTSAKEMKDNMAKSADVEYNPAHGEDGHRCDLPVGAPLEETSAATQTNMNTSPVRLKSATPKINPPHGEPGHDCSKPVGAEL